MQDLFLKISLSVFLKGENFENLDQAKKRIKQQLSTIQGLDFKSFEIAIEEIDKEIKTICEYPMEKIKDHFAYFKSDSLKILEIENDGKVYSVKLKAQKYRVFKENLKCVGCGLVASKVFLEMHYPFSPTLSFYGVKDDDLVLFTKDHIHPKSHGGKDVFSNYQTMCCTCNSIKSNYNINLMDIKNLRKKFEENSRKSKVAINQDFLDLRKKLSRPLNPLNSCNKKRLNAKTICDLHIFTNEKGELEADYFSFVENSVGCIKRNTFLKKVDSFEENGVLKIVCQLRENSDDFVIIKKENLLVKKKVR